jgi:hypothetical protein
MDWDRVRREDRYKTGGQQYVAGEQAYRKDKKVLGFKATFKGKCPNCRRPITPGQMIVKFPQMKSPVHRRCV